jgi:AcrR family transcriptional regulator
MAPRAAKAAARPEIDDGVELGGGTSVPEWTRQSVERSLKGARARAAARSHRFVSTTIELMEEQGGTDFTVQDVVDRAHMSIRTFYNFFETKDDLLVAVHETIVRSEVVPRLRKRCEAKTDPVERVRAYIDGLFELTTPSGPVSRALTSFTNRLAETRPDDLDRAFRPQMDLVTELVRDASEAGALRSELDPAKAASLLHHTVLAAVHARILGSGGRLTAKELWLFCAHGIGVRRP